MGQIHGLQDGHPRNGKDRVHAEDRMSDDRSRKARHQGRHHDEGGQILMDDLHREKTARHGCIESRRQARTGTAADKGARLHIGIVEEPSDSLTCHASDLDGRAFPAHGKAGTDAKCRRNELDHDDTEPVEALIDTQHDTPDLGDAAAAGYGNKPDEISDEPGKDQQGHGPDQDTCKRHGLQKSDHEGAPRGNEAKAEAQQRNAAAGEKTYKDPFDGKPQLERGEMDHPLQCPFRIILFHLYSSPSNKPVKSRVAK